MTREQVDDMDVETLGWMTARMREYRGNAEEFLNSEFSLVDEDPAPRPGGEFDPTAGPRLSPPPDIMELS